MSTFGVVSTHISLSSSYPSIACWEDFGGSVPDSISSPKSNPLRDGTVLFLRFGKLLLRAEGFVGLPSLVVSNVFPIWSYGLEKMWG